MKILQLIDSLMPGGAERMCVNIANLLHEAGIPVVVCVTRKDGVLSEKLLPGISYRVLGKKHTVDIGAFSALLRLIKTEKITHIHAHSTSVFWAVAVQFFQRYVKVIWHEHHGARIWQKPNYMEQICAPFLNYVLVVNQGLQTWMIRELNIHPKKVLFLNNFSSEIIPKLHKINPPILINVANVLPVKNQLMLIKACSLLKQKKQLFQLYLVGYAADSAWYNLLTTTIAHLGLKPDVHFMGSIKEVGPLLAQASVGVLSSDSEGLPLALLEYGLAGLPVVSTRVGQCGDVLDEGRCGRLVPPNNPEAFAEALYAILQDTSAASEMGQRLRARIQEQYSGAAFLKGYLPLLK